jgi:hypothetical protein
MPFAVALLGLGMAALLLPAAVRQAPSAAAPTPAPTPSPNPIEVSVTYSSDMTRDQIVKAHRERLNAIIEQSRQEAASRQAADAAQQSTLGGPRVVTATAGAGQPGAIGQSQPGGVPIQPTPPIVIGPGAGPGMPTPPGMPTAPGMPPGMAPAPIPGRPIPGAPGAPGGPAQQTVFRASRAIAYISPFQSLSAIGQEFDTDVRLMNTNQLRFDEVEIRLKYDPLVVAPLKVNDARLYEQAVEPPTLSINTSKGRLHYAARLKTELSDTTTTLLSIRWKALNPITYSQIEFIMGDYGTRIGRKGGNILGYSAGNERQGGSLSGGLIIAPEHDSPRTLLPPLSDIVLAGIDEIIHLRLEADTETVPKGEEWIVTLAVRNDANLPFNDVNAWIGFDPDKLEVVDWHEGNWIRRGINIYDGFAHDVYPFDVHRANSADNEAGLIHYEMGTTAAHFFPSGRLAQIRFRAKRDASINDVWLIERDPDRLRTTEPAGGEQVSDVTFFGASLLYERTAKKQADRPDPEPLRRPGT